MRLIRPVIIIALALSIMALGDPNINKPSSDRDKDQQEYIEEFRYDVPAENDDQPEIQKEEDSEMDEQNEEDKE